MHLRFSDKENAEKCKGFWTGREVHLVDKKALRICDRGKCRMEGKRLGEMKIRSTKTEE